MLLVKSICHESAQHISLSNGVLTRALYALPVAVVMCSDTFLLITNGCSCVQRRVVYVWRVMAVDSWLPLTFWLTNLQGRAGTRTRRRAPRKRWAIAGWRTPSSNTARKKASRVDESAIRSAHCVSLVRCTCKFVYWCPLMARYRSCRSRAVCFGLFRKYWSAVSTAWSTRASRFWRRALPPNLKSSTSFGLLLLTCMCTCNIGYGQLDFCREKPVDAPKSVV